MRRLLAQYIILLMLAIVTACAGGDTPSVTEPAPPTPPVPPPPSQPQTPGMLNLTVEGLPANVQADILLNGSGISRSATASTNWSDLPGGQYTITVRPVRATNGTYASSQTTQTVAVVSGAPPTSATVRYEALPSAVAITVSGVPGGVDAPVRVSNPSDSTAPVSSSRVLTHASSGVWRMVADTLESGGFSYAPSPRTEEATVLHGDTARLSVSYAVASGAIAVAVSGLPQALDASITVRGAGDFSRVITRTETLTNLAPGAYKLIADAVSIAGVSYKPAPDSISLDVSASLTAAPASISYAAQVGRFVITASGLPEGALPSFTLAGPNGSHPISGAASIDSLPVGSYMLSAPPVTFNGVKYAPLSGMQSVAITTGNTTSVHVTFAPMPTTVSVAVTGLPVGVNANLVLTPPAGAPIALTGNTRISPASAGVWRLAASGVTSGGAAYAPTPAYEEASVVAGDSLHFPVQYTITTGSLAVLIDGVPGGGSANVMVTGPNGFMQAVSATTTLSMLVPGTYTVSASSFSHGGGTYVANTASQERTVTASIEPSTASVSYAIATGSITISTSGLPGGITPTFTVTGSSGTLPVSGAGTVSNLNVGAYTVAAATLNNGGITYTPAPASANASVTALGNTPVAFSYTAAGGVNYSIANVHLTQATQRLDGSVPIVAGRDALLRVFVQAAGANTARPDVRVRIYDGAALLQTVTISAPEASVRTSLAQGTMQSTWNVIVPAANVRSGLRVSAELDPTGAYPDANTSDNIWPAGGGTQAITAHNVPDFIVRFVPVITGSLTGNVSVANHQQFLVSVRRLFPLANVVADIRAPFTSSATELQSGDGNGAWLTVLNEINALRMTEASAGMHYYGVVATNYGSGIAGYGYRPGRAAIGWDKMPSGDNVAAHEWGHNFSRQHAPCGVAGDVNYPYAGGVIGQIGWNVSTNALVQTNATDVMGYCSNNWISDYTWSAVLQYRGTLPFVASSFNVASGIGVDRSVKDGLLVWGRIVDGRIMLEPAFRVRAQASAPQAGDHRVQLLDSDGSTLMEASIAADAVDHVTDRDERHFAIVLPWSSALESRLANVRVRDTRSTRQALARAGIERASVQAARDPQASVTRLATGAARVSWNMADYPMAMVRDAATGQIMGFVRRSGDAVATNGRQVEVVLSDGVRSVVR